MPKTPAPTRAEMAEYLTARQNSRLYAKSGDQSSAERTSAVIHNTLTELEALAEKQETVSLSDTATVKEKTLEYVGLCEGLAVVPSFSGLSHAFGCTRQALYDFMKRNPSHATTEWLTKTHDSFRDALAQGALCGATREITSIFLLKALYGLRDTLSIEPLPMPDNSGITQADAERLSEKYFQTIDFEEVKSE